VLLAGRDPAVTPLRLSVLAGAFAVCRLDPRAVVPPALLGAAWVSITRTATELSIVCAEDLAPAGGLCERGFRCLVVEGPLPFSAVGILAGVAAPLAAAGIPILAVATYDTDYVLVRAERLHDAREALSAAGHEVGGHLG
jgi:uncharacterized protein